MDLFQRHPLNPLISPRDVIPSKEGLKVLGAFNPGAVHDGDKFRLLLRIAESVETTNEEIGLPLIEFKNGKPNFTIKRWKKNDPLLDLSDPRYIRYGEKTYLSSISHLRLASSRDGIHFTIDHHPFLFPEMDYESCGIEDPRIVKINDQWLINYTAISSIGITTALASSPDLSSIKRHGILFPPENKDICLFPEKIGNCYHCFHRPLNTLFGKHGIWYANSPDLVSWGHHTPLILPNSDLDKNVRIGGGAPCLRTEHGWLHIYHAATSQDHYSLYGALFDLDNPSKLIYRSKKPIFKARTEYETRGFLGNVVFTNGIVLHKETIYLYYGAADTYTCLAQANIKDLIEGIRTC